MARVEIGARRRDKTMGWRQCLVRLRRGPDDLHEFWLLRRRRSLLDDGTRGQNTPLAALGLCHQPLWNRLVADTLFAPVTDGSATAQ
jgi:hypothetical protein